jgi:hypothetical protein
VNLVNLSNDYLAWHEEEIREALQETIGNDDMTDYLPDALRSKIASVQWDIAKIGPAVYGKTVCELRAPLTANEQSELADWIIGQNADGALESLGDYPVETDSGDLYVSFWNSGDDYFLLPEDEFRAQILEQSVDSQGFGGMEGMT